MAPIKTFISNNSNNDKSEFVRRSSNYDKENSPSQGRLSQGAKPIFSRISP